MRDQNGDNAIDVSDRESELMPPGFSGSDVRRSAGKTTVSDSVRKQSLARARSENPFASIQENHERDAMDLTQQQAGFRKKRELQARGIIRPGDDYR